MSPGASHFVRKPFWTSAVVTQLIGKKYALTLQNLAYSRFLMFFTFLIQTLRKPYKFGSASASALPKAWLDKIVTSR
jgi:hypothetical protein